MYEDNQDPISSLVHLYVDGAFSRRELINRVAKITGSLAAAVTAVETMGVAEAQTPQACPAGIKVPADAPDIDARDVEYPGDAGTLFGYLVRPRNSNASENPVVITIHENQGLTEHHKDVARRVARAGYVALAIDLLSRQGGSSQFADPQALAAAYGRTVPQERNADMFSTMTYVKQLPGVRADRIGTVGFCAGGGNVWNLATGADDLTAAVAFYGAPVPPEGALDNMNAAMLCNYAQLDPALTTGLAGLIPALLAKRKTFGINIYEGALHAFHNDTSPNYNAAAACDAWAKTIAWFDKFLRK